MACENKTEETIAEAENQAIRDGAVIVASRLALKRYIETTQYDQPPAPDPDIFCFSLCFGPDVCRISVHWVDRVSNDLSYFHMTPVGQYFTNEKVGQGVMRTRIHNIWDFGLVKYYQQAEETYEKAVAKWRTVGDSPESAALAKAAAATAGSELCIGICRELALKKTLELMFQGTIGGIMQSFSSHSFKSIKHELALLSYLVNIKYSVKTCSQETRESHLGIDYVPSQGKHNVMIP